MSDSVFTLFMCGLCFALGWVLGSIRGRFQERDEASRRPGARR